MLLVANENEAEYSYFNAKDVGTCKVLRRKTNLYRVLLGIISFPFRTDNVLQTEQMPDVEVRPHVAHFLGFEWFGNVFKLLEIFNTEP